MAKLIVAALHRVKDGDITEQLLALMSHLERPTQDHISTMIPAEGANEHGGLTPNRSPAEPPPRRFHTVHHAAAWIQQNWPDFDLEATHPVTWREEM